jgi:hypothetical protein
MRWLIAAVLVSIAVPSGRGVAQDRLSGIEYADVRKTSSRGSAGSAPFRDSLAFRANGRFFSHPARWCSEPEATPVRTAWAAAPTSA